MPNIAHERKKRLKLNTLFSFSHQIITILCGFILPHIIIKAFGSEINGLVSSITQFLNLISFLQLGVGAVVESALYKPLAESDVDSVSRIMVSARRFFRRIGFVLIIYVLGLMIFYPMLSDQKFDWLFTSLLIACISISSFSQYYCGITSSLMLTSSQHGYIRYGIQSVTLLLNTFICILLVKFNAGIHIVKLTSSLLFLLSAFSMNWYVSKHFTINWKIKYDTEPIAQKKNGIAQHIAHVVLEDTDNVVLTLFSTLSNVSVYSVYHLVVYGVKNLIHPLTGGVRALLGELWAKQEKENFKQTYDWFEWLTHTATTFMFGCTAVLIVPFVKVYTKDVTDVDYIQPLFAAVLTSANALHCLRIPYNTTILAVGHYKQTQKCYIIAALLNVVFSVIFVVPFGLVGVALGTLVSMAYQTLWMAIYVRKSIFQKKGLFIKHFFVDAVSVLLGVTLTVWIPMTSANFVSWIILAIQVALIFGCVVLALNGFFFRDKLRYLAKIIKGKIVRT